MTIGSITPAEKKGRNIPSTDEKAPLLPKHSDSDARFDEFNGGSFTGAVFNLSTTIVGAGIMALPATMKILGLVPGLVMIVLVAILTEKSVDLLIRFSRAAKAVSYGGVVGETFGRAARALLLLCIVVNNFGVTIVYMILIGDVVSGTSSSGTHHMGLLEGWFGVHWWNGRFSVILATTLIVFAPLVSYKHVDSLKYTSALSVGLAVVFVVITAGIAIAKLLTGSIEMPKLFPQISDMASVWNLFTVSPILIFSYVCHYNVHSIDCELEDRSQMRPIVRTSFALCSIVYLTTSFFGFLLFGDSTHHDVLANFDTNLGIPYSSLLTDSVRVSYIIHLMFVFPVIFHALRLNMDSLLFRSSKPLYSDNWRFSWMTVVLLTLIFSAANFIPSIWDAFQFTGATAGVCMGFIFPAAIVLRDCHGIASNWEKMLAVFMIVLAVLSNVIAIYSDAYSLFHKIEVSAQS